MNELGEQLVEVWAGLQQNVIDDAFGLQEDILSICCDCILATYRIWFVKFVENLLIYR